jgi:hypothetical protein
MSLNPAQASWLDQLATNALDALRDQDRAAVNAATVELHRRDDKLAELEQMRDRAERAELALFDAIHSLVIRPATPLRPTARRRRLTAFLGR